MGRHYIHDYLTPSDSMAGMNYFDSNRTNTVILKFEAVKVMPWLFHQSPTLRNFKNGKTGN